MGMVHGLCGNFDGLTENEYSGGVFNAQKFGNLYKTEAYCKNIDQITVDNYDPCEEHAERNEWAVAQCQQIKGPKFQECRKKLNWGIVDMYYEACIYDACG